MIELSEVFKAPGAVVDWANRVNYETELSQEDKEVNAELDAWAREIGKKGDVNHELSAMIAKSFENPEYTFPTEIIDRMFDADSVGEFDDYTAIYAPTNTIVAHEAIIEGNVDRSFIEHTVGRPVWFNLAAETDISMQDLRRGGYRTVATLVGYMNEALELKRVRNTMTYLNTLALHGITESTTMPTVASMDELELYLHDVSDGETPFAFMQSKYHQAATKLPQANYMYLLTDREKNMYHNTGRIDKYAGIDLLSYSGQKKLADGQLVMPDKVIYGVAGKIGSAITRGEARVLQEENINSERIHIKVNGFTFGFCVNPAQIHKMAKMTLA